MILAKNHPHPPPFCFSFRPLPPRPIFESIFLDPLDPVGLYMFFVSTLMMSKLSDSSPVSAEKPRYAALGILKGCASVGCRLKHSVHESSALYCSCKVNDLSWK